MATPTKANPRREKGPNNLLVTLVVLAMIGVFAYSSAVWVRAPYPEVGALIIVTLVAIVIVRLRAARARYPAPRTSHRQL